MRADPLMASSRAPASVKAFHEIFDCDLPVPASKLGPMSRRVLEKVPELPLPGKGSTLTRWQALADIAAIDICLAKILEAHYDAQAILQEITGHPAMHGGLWGVWAAEPPHAVVDYTSTTAAGGIVSGTKAWCSGADLVSHALITVREGDSRRLVGLKIGGKGVSAPARSWNAVGMARVISGELTFSSAHAEPVGAPDDYLTRPGFWHGGAGIAACWFGAAKGIADTLRTSGHVSRSGHARTHLGFIDMQLGASRALLRELAGVIDEHPELPHIAAVIRVRSFVERTCTIVMDRVGRALGAGPMCMDAAHAQRCADLTTFIRQSHAESDWDALGQSVAEQEESWHLL